MNLHSYKIHASVFTRFTTFFFKSTKKPNRRKSGQIDWKEKKFWVRPGFQNRLAANLAHRRTE